jgi:hypothetical protein
MVSKAKTPEKAARAAPLAALVWLALSAMGCPSRETDIRISPKGISWLTTACMPCGSPVPIPPSRTDHDGSRPPPPGFPPLQDPVCACALPDHYPPGPFGRSVTEARLFLVTPGDNRIQDASKCMTLHPCGDGGRLGSSHDCMSSDLNQQLDGAMPRGLGFDGLKNPEDTHLILALYQPTESSTEGTCSRTNLFACAGLAPPLGGGNYDITCASCQGGSRTAAGPDNGPCPRDQAQRGSCFLQQCDALLEQNGYE